VSSSRGTAERAAPAGSVHADIPILQTQAAILTPEMRHARSLLDAAIRVLEYFETNAAAWSVVNFSQFSNNWR